MVKPRAWLQQYKLSFYFDYISPYAYFAHRRLNLPPTHPHSFFRGLREGSNTELQIEYKPVLLAGLLKHWGQLGPAEV
jgi:2-hydroxychromene-2-carboxylate isomerase